MGGFISFGVMRRNIMFREYIARDPRTGRPINVGSNRRQRKKREVREGPWMAIPPQAVIPLATGELNEYKVGYKEKTTSWVELMESKHFLTLQEQWPLKDTKSFSNV